MTDFKLIDVSMHIRNIWSMTGLSTRHFLLEWFKRHRNPVVNPTRILREYPDSSNLVVEKPAYRLELRG